MRIKHHVRIDDLVSRRLVALAAIGGIALFASLSVAPAPAAAACFDQCMSNCNLASGRSSCRSKCFRKCEAPGGKRGRG